MSERAWSISVPHHARGASLARRGLTACLLETRVDPELAADAITVLSELVGNAARHADPLRGDVIRLWWSLAPHRVELRVVDGGSRQAPMLRLAENDAVGGRGLQIVAALAARWGVDADAETRCVWAELTR